MNIKHLFTLVLVALVPAMISAQKLKKKELAAQAVMTEKKVAKAPAVVEEPEPTITEECVINVSLFHESVKNKQYADAYGPWWEVYTTCPNANKIIYTDGAKIVEALYKATTDEAEKERRMDTLQYQIAELERAKLQEGEEEALTSRRNLLRNGEKFISAVSGCDHFLSGGDDSDGVLTLLKRAQESLGSVRNLDESFSALYERLQEAYSEIYDIADTVSDQRANFDFSPNELDEVESRLEQLTKEEYLQMQQNVKRIAKEIAQGASCRRAIREAYKILGGDLVK